MSLEQSDVVTMHDEAPPSVGPAGPGGEDERDSQHWNRILEIAITTILSLATLLTAWSGYQAARWSGVQASSYSLAAARRVDATKAATLAGQLGLYDTTIFSAWVAADAAGNTQLETFEARRFRPEFATVFSAWLATNPFSNAGAPASPMEMPGYENGLERQSNDLENQALVLFDQGSAANQQADEYVLTAVFLAAALFLAGMASRFAWRPVRFTVVGLSGAILVFSLIDVFRSPIA